MVIAVGRLQEFMRLYEDEFKEQINEEEAREMAFRLVELYSLLVAPLASEKKPRASSQVREAGGFEQVR